MIDIVQNLIKKNDIDYLTKEIVYGNTFDLNGKLLNCLKLKCFQNEIEKRIRLNQSISSNKYWAERYDVHRNTIVNWKKKLDFDIESIQRKYINQLYFKEHITISEIEGLSEISYNKISKVLNANKRMKEKEKLYRSYLSKKRKNNYNKEYKQSV